MKDYEITFYIMQFVIILLTLALIFVTIKAVSLILLIVFAVIASSLNIALLVSGKK